ncbi:MAG: hypothetical protein GX993_05585 [Bacteroidales bacterium]|nr:hypothetical protein [Bacteroidales bacterium]
MKKSFWALFIFAFSLIGCEKKPVEFEKVEYVKYSHQLFEEDVNLEGLIKQGSKELGATPRQLLADFGFDEKESKSILEKLNLYIMLSKDQTVHGIAYNTKDPLGNPVVASGLLYYPKNNKPKGVLFIYPFFKSKSNCGTDLRYSIEAILNGLGEYVCLIPDGIGFGLTSDLPMSIIHNKNIAETGIDLYLAAEEFIYNNYKRKLPREITLFGYSRGAPGAWSMARLLSKDKTLRINVKDIFIGSGLYYPELYLETVFETCYSEFAAAPFVLWSMNYYENLNLDLTKMLTGKMLEEFPSLCNGSIGIQQVTSIVGTDLRNYFDYDFLKNEENPYRQIIVQALKKNSIPNDWKPECKVHLYNCFEDSFVPPICGETLYQYLKEINADVEFTQKDVGHQELVIYMTIDFFKHIYPNL